jgi:hypothetical protein
VVLYGNAIWIRSGVLGCPLVFIMAWRSVFFKFLDEMRYKLFGGV